ncbi:hypothetical protein M9H77_14121 [Catharanthus roseus]|uniref:Uncharacterized protein n=1 Tax=Catharanthus roseus TaxID=4058 RepID=A0ACC0BMB7_CATRO|nr:hypothetical protein M9H77_14121 [Catharanthus roseus]
MSKRRFDRRPYVILGCERGERRKKKARLDDDDEDEEEELPAARLTDDHLKITEEFSRCQVAPQNIMASLLEKNPDCAVSKQTIYNVRVKMKKKRMQGRNTI